MTFEEIEKDWKAGKAKPVYVFHGEEDFLRSELVHAAPELFLPDEGTRSFNFDLLYGPETSMADVISMAQSYPVMAEKRVVIVREAERLIRPKAEEGAAPKKRSKNKGEDPLLGYLAHPNTETLLVFDMQKMGPRNTSPFKELAEKAVVVEFAAMKDAGVIAWIRERARRKGKQLSELSAKLLVAHLGTSLRTHANELEKLITYTGEAKEISEKDVETVVGVSREFNVFELTKAIGNGKKQLAAEIVLKMLSQDSGARQMILVMLARYIEQLTIALEMQIKGENERAIADALELRGGAAFYVKDYTVPARRYTRSRLDHALKAIVNAEAQTRKISNIDEPLLFESLIVEMVPQ